MTKQPVYVSLQEFSKKVGCHTSSASRYCSGDRMPSREVLYRIIKAYKLDPKETIQVYCGPKAEFGKFMRANVFHVSEEEWLSRRR